MLDPNEGCEAPPMADVAALPELFCADELPNIPPDAGAAALEMPNRLPVVGLPVLGWPNRLSDGVAEPEGGWLDMMLTMVCSFGKLKDVVLQGSKAL